MLSESITSSSCATSSTAFTKDDDLDDESFRLFGDTLCTSSEVAGLSVQVDPFVVSV